MKLNRIKLENIRSYQTSEISFPESTTLLSGDIGSGKSTILLAIDFALFGIRRGELSGGSLLRNGENNGSVELEFSIDDKDIVIKRTLKRESKSVVQSSGYIIVNGERKEATAVELKQSILDLLCYPKELLMKSKSLIYRYTVYTPQEEMKQILLGDKDYRLDTLRRVFGIDKYKRIKDNTKIYVSYLKGKRKEFEGKIFDLDDKKKQKEEKNVELNVKQDSVSSMLPKLNEVSGRLKIRKEELEKTEKDLEKFRNLEKEYENIKVNLNLKEETLPQLNERLVSLDEYVNKIKLSEEKFDKKELEIVKKRLNERESVVDNLKKKVNEVEVKKKNSEEIKDGISKLDECPTCKQRVTSEYKNEIFDRVGKEIINFDMILEEQKGLLNSSLSELEVLKKKLEILREKEARVEALELKRQNFEEKSKEKERLSKEVNDLKNEIETWKLKENEFKNELQGASTLEDKYKSLKNEIETVSAEQKKFEIEKVSIEREIDNVKEIINSLDKEINEKLKVKDELEGLSNVQRWLEEYLVGVVDVIERKVMLRVHSEFSILFKKWFDMLIEDELVDVSLDEEFTPKIEQNGHDIDYYYLSGGEKTAAALAYRLALNQVINDLVSVIKTKDLLILDEPTDGFSYEQLERMEKVLRELDIKQIVLVSHESRIESFVDNVVKLRKEGHISNVHHNL